MHYSVNGAVLRQCVLSFVVFIAIAFGTAQANQPHEHDKDNHAQHADDAGQEHEPHTELIRFAPGMLQSAGIVQQIAKPGSLQRKLPLWLSAGGSGTYQPYPRPLPGHGAQRTSTNR